MNVRPFFIQAKKPGFIFSVVFAIGISIGLGISPTLLPTSEPTPILEAHAGQAPMAQPTSLSFSSTADSILEFNRHLIEISKRVKPAVVNISIIGTQSHEFPNFLPHSLTIPSFEDFLENGLNRNPHRRPNDNSKAWGQASL